MLVLCHPIAMTYRNDSWCGWSSLQWISARMHPLAYTQRKRPVYRWVLLNTITSLFCPLPEQLWGLRRQLKILRKWAFRKPRQPAGPVLLCLYKAVGLVLSKNTILFWKRNFSVVGMLLPPWWSKLMCGKKLMIDPSGIPCKRKEFGQPVHQKE